MNHNLEPAGYPLGRAGRVLLTAWSLLLLAGFALAYSVKPDPRGYGTHQQLGLPPCSFRVIFGISCPSCGMTTSLAYFVRGRFVTAAHANPAGLLLAVLAVAQIPWCWVSAYSGRLWRVRRPEAWCIGAIGLVACVGLVQWVFRLVLER